MILKASQRSGARQLANHLLNDRDNDHVRVADLRGFVADDLHGALDEAYAISRGTKCQQFMFSLSVNPPKGVATSESDLIRAADEAEKRLGLDGQPRAIVIHEKEGRRHAHVVWSRIDADEMRAVNMAHFKRKLTGLSRELFLEHGWTLPEGLRTHGGRSPLNFTLAEWQQARRKGLDPREIKDAIRDAWARSDSAGALKAALEERGYFLAKGDRRAVVVIDTDGEVYALTRQAGVKTKDVRARIPDADALPSVADVKAELAGRVGTQVKAFVNELRVRQARETAKDRAQLAAIVNAQRAERARLEAAQAQRWAEETRARATRFRSGLPGLWDALTGRKNEIRALNEADALRGLARDRAQREALVRAHLADRQPFHSKAAALRARHKSERQFMIREAVTQWRRLARPSRERSPDRAPETPRRERRGPSLDL